MRGPLSEDVSSTGGPPGVRPVCAPSRDGASWPPSKRRRRAEDAAAFRDQLRPLCRRRCAGAVVLPHTPTTRAGASVAAVQRACSAPWRCPGSTVAHTHRDTTCVQRQRIRGDVEIVQQGLTHQDTRGSYSLVRALFACCSAEPQQQCTDHRALICVCEARCERGQALGSVTCCGHVALSHGPDATATAARHQAVTRPYAPPHAARPATNQLCSLGTRRQNGSACIRRTRGGACSARCCLRDG